MTWLPIAVTAAPAAEPVSLAEAKAQTHVDGSDNDVELEIYRSAVREHVEAYTGLKLITQTAMFRCSSFDDLVRLPTAPIANITSIEYLDADGAEQALSEDVYEAVLIGLEPAIRLKPGQSWPALRAVSDAVRVTAMCGYGEDGTDVPASIRWAILLIIGDAMANREDTNVGNIINSMPNSAEALLSNYRLTA